VTAPAKPAPEATPVSAPFWSGLAEHRIRIQYSPTLAKYIFYPRVVAPGCLVDDLEWREISGLGSLYTFSIAHRPTAPPWADSVPQILAVVEWDAGPRFSTELIDVEPGDVSIGMRVKPMFLRHPDVEMTILKYAPDHG
jgi:uncharacterized OB-fold protein